MSKQQRYTEEFKLAAVKQVTERNYPVAEVAERLGISSHSLYVWIKRYSQPEAQQQDDSSQQAEIRRLKAELRRVTDERDILKKGRRVLCQAVRVRYAFIQEHASAHPIRRLCRMMNVHPSGYYAWQHQPLSARALEDQRLLGQIKQCWLESGGHLWLSQDPG